MIAQQFASVGRVVTRIRQPFVDIRQLLFDPEGFMERKVGGPSYKSEMLIVLLLGALAVPGNYFLGEAVLDATTSDMMRFTVFGQILGPVILLGVLWILLSVAFHFLSNHFRGQGGIGRVLKATGWGMIPIGIGAIAHSVASYFVYPDVDADAAITQAGWTQAEQFQAVAAEGMHEPIMLAALAIFALSVVWSGYIMAIGVKHAKRISHEDAMKTVAVPLGIYMLFFLLAVVRASPNYTTFL